jgi:hypothetical protein
MRKVKEVLRLYHEKNLSTREIGQSLGIGRSTVHDYLDRAQKAGFGWPLPPDLDEASLEHRLFPTKIPIPSEKRQMPPMESLHQELKKKGVTLQLLWDEYKQGNPDGYQYSQFCRIYHQWAEKLDPCLRQEYRAGEKLFVDYAGQTMPIVDSITGVITEAQIFVATLGASNYTFAEASLSRRYSTRLILMYSHLPPSPSSSINWATGTSTGKHFGFLTIAFLIVNDFEHSEQGISKMQFMISFHDSSLRECPQIGLSCSIFYRFFLPSFLDHLVYIL